MSHRLFSIIALLLVSIWLSNCGQQPPPGQTGETVATAQPETAVFRLSTASPPDPATPQANWCYAKFGENVLINAERINTNRRYFYLPPGVTKLSVGTATTSATLLLRPLPGGQTEVFTGSNFPVCLSNPSNLSPAGGSSKMRYFNRANIDFNMDMQVENGQTKITIELKPGANYGISVNRCPECQ